MPPAKEDDRPTPISIRLLLFLSVLLLAAVLYNAFGGGWQGQAGGRTLPRAFHEAAIPLQKRVRPSKYAHTIDPDAPDQVVVGIPATTSATAVAAAGMANAKYITAPSTAAAVITAPSTAAAVTTAVASVMTSTFAARVDHGAQSFPQGLDEGLSCHAREGYDIAGDDAYVWGLGFNVESAAECCAACAAQRRHCGRQNSRGKEFWRASRRDRTRGRCNGKPNVCNAWVFCPGGDVAGATDRCFSYTIHNHTKGECWLKHESNESYPVAAGPTLPLRMRRAPRRDWPWAVAENVWPWEVPERVQWQAGIVARREAPIWKGTRLPEWHGKFCRGKHGPC